MTHHSELLYFGTRMGAVWVVHSAAPCVCEPVVQLSGPVRALLRIDPPQPCTGVMGALSAHVTQCCLA